MKGQWQDPGFSRLESTCTDELEEEPRRIHPRGDGLEVETPDGVYGEHTFHLGGIKCKNINIEHKWLPTDTCIYPG